MTTTIEYGVTFTRRGRELEQPSFNLTIAQNFARDWSKSHGWTTASMFEVQDDYDDEMPFYKLLCEWHYLDGKLDFINDLMEK